MSPPVGQDAGPTGGWFDADAHVIEPPWIWSTYTPRALHDRIPRLERRDGSDWLVCDGEALLQIGRLGGLARREGKLRLSAETLAGTWEDSIVAGAYDPPERLHAMAVDGVARCLLFPTIAMMFFGLVDAQLRSQLLRAYNRWITDFCAARPDAFLGVSMVDPEDLTGATAAIEEAAANGQAAVLVPLWNDAPAPYHEREYDRLWAMAAGAGLPVGFHAFAARANQPVEKDRNLALDAVVERPAAVQRALANLIFGGTFERTTQLRWFSAENDAGWCPYFLERADHVFARGREAFDINRRPSEQFHEHVFVTFTSERVPVANAELIGADNLMWGSDYPHNVTTWPDSHPRLERVFDELAVPEPVRNALTRDNGERLFGR
jgi:predicted TIM-barrel fold metal-dependent hydrolase